MARLGTYGRQAMPKRRRQSECDERRNLEVEQEVCAASGDGIKRCSVDRIQQQSTRSDSLSSLTQFHLPVQCLGFSVSTRHLATVELSAVRPQQLPAAVGPD